MLKVRLENRGFNGVAGAPPFLRLIWAANKIDKTMFGLPILTTPYTEQYPRAMVEFTDENRGDVVVTALTPYAAVVLRKALDDDEVDGVLEVV